MITPYELRILLDVHCGAPISVNPAAPIYATTIAAMIERDFIRQRGNDFPDMGAAPQEYTPTEKLNVLMHHILFVPDPVWRMP